MKTGPFIEGVAIISKHTPEEELNNWNLHAEHDQIWFGADEWVTDKKDRERLDELGWFIDEESWSCFT
tara:strand:- start:14957 stop:15160 length:204 start_codon:yes stop_codon:yes gene_type:complete